MPASLLRGRGRLAEPDRSVSLMVSQAAVGLQALRLWSAPRATACQGLHALRHAAMDHDAGGPGGRVPSGQIGRSWRSSGLAPPARPCRRGPTCWGPREWPRRPAAPCGPPMPKSCRFRPVSVRRSATARGGPAVGAGEQGVAHRRGPVVQKAPDARSRSSVDSDTRAPPCLASVDGTSANRFTHRLREGRSTQLGQAAAL